jgi:kexin
MSALLGSTTWLFVALGTIIVFLAGLGAFFLLRRRQLRKNGGGGRGGYAFAPASDFEEYEEEEEEFLPMRSMDGRGGRGGSGSGGVRLGGGEGRTRELFNAFALNSDEEDEDGSDGEGRTEDPGPRKSVQRKRASIELQEGPFRDSFVRLYPLPRPFLFASD